MTDRKTASTINDAELDQLYAELTALRQVARGYCPTCGRGDAAPTVHDWEQQRTRAAQAEDLLRIAHDTSNKSEAERARAEARADQLARILHVVLGEFRPEHGTSQATAWIDTDTLNRWRAAIKEKP